MSGEVLVMVGTVKGAFLLQSDSARQRFQISGPHLAGNEVAALTFDNRGGRRRILAAASSFWGNGVRASDDLGASWSEPVEGNVKFPAETETALARVWQLEPGGADQARLVYAGAEPAALFRSEDGGETFSLVQGLWDHPHRPTWQPGGGGLCLHTVLIDPADQSHVTVAISTGGVYQSSDSGSSWRPTNTGIKADFMPDPYPEYGQCVHKVDRDPTNPQRLYLQNHGGLYRSDDNGNSWLDIANGVPSDFGFPMVAHPRKESTAYIIPLDPEGRWTPGGSCRVYRTRDAGASWEPLSNGLPQERAYVTVLRDGFCTDGLDPAGLYFGTRTGQVFGSSDEGESWRLLVEYLPPVLCVKAAPLA